ncbi:MAG: ABC transporter permease [Myxococcales bacterium]|nr:ABC transporter permease [Myxococcales bacterium]
MSEAAERLGGSRLHWMIAWRHLRAGDRAPTFVTPLFFLAAYLILVGLGLSAVAYLGGPEAADVAKDALIEGAPLVPELSAGAPPEPPPIEAYYGLIGGSTLFVGLMLLLGAALSRVFTLLATVIIISVMLGCMALVVVLSLMTGLEHELRDKILGQLSHIRIARDDHRPFSDYLELTAKLAEAPGVVGVSPYLKGEVMVRNGLNRQGGILTGIIPEREATVSYLPDIVDEGKYDYLDHPERIPEASFSFEVTREDPPPQGSKGGKIKPQLRGLDDDDDENELGLGAVIPRAKPGAGGLPEPIKLPAPVFSDDADEGWEDPAVEIPKLRADGELPDKVDAPDEIDEADGAEKRTKNRKADLDAVIKRYGVKGPLKADDEPPPATTRVPLPRPGSDEDEGWEDPALEIAKLRDEGVLPPAPETEGEGETAGSGAADPEPDGAPDESDATDEEGDAEPDALAPVLLGSEKARELIAHVGDRVQLITPIGRQTPVGRMPGRMDVRVAGVFNANHYEYDRWLVYAPLATVQSFLRTGDRISGIEVRVDDVDRIPERKVVLQGILKDAGRDDLVVRDWQELNASLFSAMALEKIAVFIALLCVILVASFGILGSNLMSVLEKSKEIAILKTMGTSDSLIQRVFIAEGLCLGILGGLIGVIVGIALCVVLDRFGLPLSGDLSKFEPLPVAIDPVEIVVVVVSALIIVWLSSLYPARVASRMRPVEALRKAEA